MALGRGRYLPNKDVVNVIKLSGKIVAVVNLLPGTAALQGWVWTPIPGIHDPDTLPFLAALCFLSHLAGGDRLVACSPLSTSKV